MADNRPIGVFDSGIGGISVLRNMVRRLPHERFIYYGDTRNAPYGTRTEPEIRQFSESVVNTLLRQGVKAIVIACNTASSAAAQSLRERYAFPIVAMEPALKPAVQMVHAGRVLTLATPATLQLRKFARLMEQYGEHAERVPCPGLMEFAERGECDSEALHAFLTRQLASYSHSTPPVAAVVLGCTHYVFLRKAIQRIFPGVPLVDGNEGTARQLQRVLAANEQLASDTQVGDVRFQTSGDLALVEPIMARLFHMPIDA